MRVLELFAGIGGCAVALGDRAADIAAIDQDEAAHTVYVHNHTHPAQRLNLAGVKPPALAAHEADLWWMSPPCQPFTVRGRQRDVDDPRCGALLNVLRCIDAVRPRWVALENVPGFAGSRAHGRLTSMLRGAGYGWVQAELCPSTWGVPNRRRRFYLLARHEGQPAPFPPPASATTPLRAFLDDSADPALAVSQALQERYASALAVVRADDATAVAECFTSAYGRSPVYAGSYLRQSGGLRRFSPTEIVRLLGFPRTFAWPAGLALAKRYKLAGNSLSVHAVRVVLAQCGG
ncbi:MAG: DNA cytosine methyltransferase [Myxococcales bacterium]|nr:DNA cytosine methyltransferase [Myxococcales bacterium]